MCDALRSEIVSFLKTHCERPYEVVAAELTREDRLNLAVSSFVLLITV